MTELDPANLSQADRYKLLIGGIVPRPIAFVSTIDAAGRTNLAPFSFFAGISSEPMAIAFCPANNAAGEMKDTLRNCLPPGEGEWGAGGGLGEFVVNTVSESFERQMAACAEPLAFGDSEFDLSGLTPEPSSVVRPPRVAESPLAFECRTMRVIRLAPGIAGGGNLVIGRIVHIRARERLLNERFHVDPELLGAIGRMGGLGYCRTHDRFEMPMGRDALSTRA